MARNRKPSAADSIDNTAKDEAFKRLAKELEQLVPKDYEEQGDNVIGYWAPEHTPIYCVPLSAKLFDGNIEKRKPSILIITRLLAPCAIARKEDGEMIPDVAKMGDLVGIWGKPGLKSIRYMANVPVVVRLTGELEIGKPNPMKTFSVQAPKNAPKTLIPVLEDTRDFSLDVAVFLDQAPMLRDRSGKRKPPATDYEQNIPYNGQLDEEPENTDELDKAAGL